MGRGTAAEGGGGGELRRFRPFPSPDGEECPQSPRPRSPIKMTRRQVPPLEPRPDLFETPRSEEHTYELQSLMRISYAVFCLKKKKTHNSAPTLKVKQP